MADRRCSTDCDVPAAKTAPRCDSMSAVTSRGSRRGLREAQAERAVAPRLAARAQVAPAAAAEWQDAAGSGVVAALASDVALAAEAPASGAGQRGWRRCRTLRAVRDLQRAQQWIAVGGRHAG